MKTELFTNFVCIATAGATVDGRHIDAKDLKDMAESYNPEVYTALIWLEHYRNFGNYGRVVELKTEDEEGKTKLYARLAPNAQLLELNQSGQKIFTSIEITPNFAQTGKAYLSGLAITDSPASTGTNALMFNRIGSKDVIISDHLEFNINFLQEVHNMNEITEQEKNHFFSKFFNWLFSGEQSEIKENQENTANTGNPTAIEIDNMDKQEFSTLIATAVAGAVAQAFSAQAEQQQAEKQQAKEQVADKPTEQPVETVSKQEFNELKTKYEALEAKFNQLLQPVTQTPSELGNTDNMFNLENSGF